MLSKCHGNSNAVLILFFEALSHLIFKTILVSLNDETKNWALTTTNDEAKQV